MSLLGVHLTVLVGPTVATPAPPFLADVINSVSVQHGDEPSGAQIRFQTGRSGPLGAMDFPLLHSPLLKPFNRVILIVTFNATPHVLFDGLITNQELQPGDTPGSSALTITAEDVSYAMDQKSGAASHPAMDDATIVRKIIAAYGQYGLIPKVETPMGAEAPDPTERSAMQRGTDREYVQALARHYGFVFYVAPGPAPGTNVAYWGPPDRAAEVQPALSVNMGSASNVESIGIQYNALQARLFEGQVQDRRTGEQQRVQVFGSTRVPPLAAQPAILADQAGLRRALVDTAGLTTEQAQAAAQALTDASTDDVVTLTGTLDATRYGRMLKPRALVRVRGAGFSFDGLYRVKHVEHMLQRGQYRQSFTLAREGKGSTVPAVVA
jgi:hypothetical protein